MGSRVPTRCIVFSDTHGDEPLLPEGEFDVALHCGDLTEESKLDEFKASVQWLKRVNAPLKLVIAGNHDFTLDPITFRRQMDEMETSGIEDDLIRSTFGSFGEARQLFESADVKASGIVLLSEDEGHDWTINKGVDIAMTHGPPRGILDYTDSKTRAGCPSLFGAIAYARPQVHCFGHIHEGWGAKRVTWRDDISEKPSHFTAIDNDQSETIESLASIRPRKFDTDEIRDEKAAALERLTEQGYCRATGPIKPEEQTMFINAAIHASLNYQMQLPWTVDLGLPRFMDGSQSRKRTSSDAGFGSGEETSCKKRSAEGDS